MNSISKFKRRVSRSGSTLKEKAENEISRNFKKLLKENPSCYEVQATQPNEVYVTEGSNTISVMINDISLNDKTAVDEKYIHVDKEENIDVGCYVKWRNLDWLLVFEEVNAVNSHKTFIMKRCNQLFKFIYEGELYEVPVVATNLTLYSDGLADGVYLSRADAKRNIKFGTNYITRKLDIGHRIMLTNKTVFRITHMDDFSYNGLTACITGQTALVPEDDLENNIAYNPLLYDPHKEIETRNSGGISFITTRTSNLKIEGVSQMMLGSYEEFSISNHNVSWHLESSDNIVELIYENSGVCRIGITTTNSKYIGHKFSLVAKINEEEVSRKEITIKSYF